MPTSPVITVIDNENGTATVSVTGTTAGYTNTLKSQNVDLQQKLNTWTTQDNRVGDGDIVVSLPNGFYYFYVESAGGAGPELVGSAPVRSRVSDGSLSIYSRVMEAVKATVLEGSLTGVPDERVYVRTIPQDSLGLVFPCVFICPYGAEFHNPGSGTNTRDSVIYPVIVAYLDGADQDAENVTLRDVFLGNRERVSNAFRNQRLSGVSESQLVSTKYVNVVDPNAWFNHNVIVGGIVLNCEIWQVRGLV